MSPLRFWCWPSAKPPAAAAGMNVWWSAPGSLTFSLLFDAATIGVPLDRWPQVSLAAALAVRQTVADALPGDDVSSQMAE